MLVVLPSVSFLQDLRLKPWVTRFPLSRKLSVYLFSGKHVPKKPYFPGPRYFRCNLCLTKRAKRRPGQKGKRTSAASLPLRASAQKMRRIWRSGKRGFTRTAASSPCARSRCDSPCIAMANGDSIATRNQKHFSKAPGLRLEKF